LPDPVNNALNIQSYQAHPATITDQKLFSTALSASSFFAIILNIERRIEDVFLSCDDNTKIFGINPHVLRLLSNREMDSSEINDKETKGMKIFLTFLQVLRFFVMIFIDSGRYSLRHERLI
jgi:hypothetical protein